VGKVPNPVEFYGPPTYGNAYRSWRNARMDGGGFVSGLIASPLPEGPLFARTDVGGAYLWEAGKKVWKPITDNLAGSQQVESMAADPMDKNLVYVASAGKIHRSGDLGETWTSHVIPAAMAGNGDGRCVGERLAVDPNRATTLFFGSRRAGLLRSDDGAATWRPVPGFTDWKDEKEAIGITFVLFDKRSGGAGRASSRIFLGVRGSKAWLYESKDGGETWNPVAGQSTGNGFPNHAVLSPSGMLYLTCANAGGPNGMSDGALWRYNTAQLGPQAWREISPVDPAKAPGDQFGYGSLALDPKKSDVLVVATMDRWNYKDAMWRTIDASVTTPVWTTLFSKEVRPLWRSPAPYKSRDTHWISDIEFAPGHSEQIFFGFGLGVQRTDNVSAGAGAIWNFSAQGLEETVALCGASPPVGPQLLSGLGDIAGFVHTDLTVSPAVSLSSGGNTTGVDFAGANPKIMARVGGRPGQYSLDGGATWKVFGSQSPGKNGGIAIGADGKEFLWGTEAGVHVSRDCGGSWQKVSSLPIKCKLAADRSKPGAFYAYENSTGTVFSSTDGTASFLPSSSKLPNCPWYYRSSIRSVPGFAGHVYVSNLHGFGIGGLYKSIDGAKTFLPVAGVDNKRQPITGNTSIVSINGFGFGKGSEDRYYPAMYLSGRVKSGSDPVSGIFRSDDGGTSWIRINDAQHHFDSPVIFGDGRTPLRVHLGTSGRGFIYGDP